MEREKESAVQKRHEYELALGVNFLLSWRLNEGFAFLQGDAVKSTPEMVLWTVKMSPPVTGRCCHCVCRLKDHVLSTYYVLLGNILLRQLSLDLSKGPSDRAEYRKDTES